MVWRAVLSPNVVSTFWHHVSYHKQTNMLTHVEYTQEERLLSNSEWIYPADLIIETFKTQIDGEYGKMKTKSANSTSTEFIEK